MKTRVRNTLICLALIALAGTAFVACGKSNGFGIGGKVIITGGAQ